MDYYRVLGVEEGVDEHSLKRAFRKLSRQYHPDLNPDDTGAEEKIKEINEAYSVLSDTDQRREYDYHRGRQHHPSFNPLQHPGNLNIDDLFKQFFGGQIPRRPGNHARPRPPHPPREKTVNFQIPLSKLTQGGPVITHVRINEENVCSSCRGVGGEEIVQCAGCNGAGHFQQTKKGQNITITNTQACPQCAGSGRALKSPCNECSGVGTVVTPRRFKIALHCEEES
jgi:molecular chaperone DnaJ